MVLSNKKLKQKIRAQLAESLAASESQNNQSNPNDPQTHHQSLKSLLNSATQKPSLSKREKRRVKAPSSQESRELEGKIENGVPEKEAEKGVEIATEGGSMNSKKRKRGKDAETGESSAKKSSKKKKKNKKKKKKVKEEGAEIANGGSEEKAAEVAETITAFSSKEDLGISTKVYVGGIPYYSTVDDIRSFFEGCGSITEIDCLKFPETGKFNGIAMISFRTEAAAKRALALDGSDMGGLSLKVQPYKGNRNKKVSDFAPEIVEGYNRIYVGNLSWDITEDELKKLFSDCTISSIRLGKDKETGEFRGYAHVDFDDSLSLSMALKLDQKLINGRPVRIRCAVPPKSGNSKSMPVGTKKVGETSAPIGAKTNEPTSKTQTSDAVANDDVVNVVSGKIKRRTCYDCGEKGHVSSSCPKIKAADVVNSANEANDLANERAAFTSVVTMAKREADNNLVNSVSDGTLRRRTCYECGEKGHISSVCPKKQRIDEANFHEEANNRAVGKADTFTSVVVVGKEETDNDMVNSVSDGKLRRRTCYGCGEKGHISSACPRIQAAGVVNSGKEAVEMELEDNGDSTSVVAVAKEAHTDRVDSISGGKLRRRTCYECGEKGHLSSSCPNKK